MKFLFVLIALFFTINVQAKAKKDLLFYQKVFPNINSLKSVAIPDPINYKPVNTEILVVFDKNKNHLGYIREVKTNSGCDSACLPIIFTLFYNSDKSYKKLLSKVGLMKINHDDFTAEDYFSLESILLKNPKIFEKVTHPFDMVDGITRATTKEYSNSVVKTAAFSTLRINTYNQHTLKELKKIQGPSK